MYRNSSVTSYDLQRFKQILKKKKNLEYDTPIKKRPELKDI